VRTGGRQAMNAVPVASVGHWACFSQSHHMWLCPDGLAPSFLFFNIFIIIIIIF
jgi:hypothetical protein